MSIVDYFESKKPHKVKTKDGVELSSYIYGEGEPVVFLTNFFMVCKYWGQFLGDIAEKYKVVTFDFRNQGASSRVKNIQLKDYETDIRADQTIWRCPGLPSNSL